MTNNLLLITLPETEVERLKAMRDFIMASLEGGVMVLPVDAAWEIIEAPPLGRVEVLVEETSAVGADSIRPNPAEAEPPTLAEEKRAILQRLKDYREAHGRGCLAAVSRATRSKGAISEDPLRSIAMDQAPKLEISDWRKINRALDRLEVKEAAGDG